MARGGLSQDPETRKRQLDALAAGREIARTRRAAGLPARSRQSRQSVEAGDSRQSSQGARVVPGNYGKGDDGREKPERKPAAKHTTPANEGTGQPGGIVGFLGKLWGYDA